MTEKELNTLLDIFHDLAQGMPLYIRERLINRLKTELPHMNWDMLVGSARGDKKDDNG